jgi:4-hydroxy-3-polyprenylbenzoate decarboxylase
LDGGDYLGTGDIVVIRDRDTGWVNLGAYRLMIHDKDSGGLFFQAVRHGFQLARKYWDNGEGCPAAISLGQEPVVFLAAGVALGYVRDKISEYDFAGYVRGTPLDVVEGKLTGLPIPAAAEIVLEGEILPLDEQRMEGPFGEFTGYYGHKVLPAPVFKVKAIYYRNNPITIGAPPMKPTFGGHFSMTLGVAQTWNRLEARGITCIRDIRRVSGFSALAICVQQKSATDVEELVAALSELQSFHRLAIIVDEDIDLDDPKDLIWAVGTRCEAKTGAIVVNGMSREELDPIAPPDLVEAREPFEVSKMIINACKPYGRIKHFPEVNVFSNDYRKRTIEKWKKELPFLTHVKVNNV